MTTIKDVNDHSLYLSKTRLSEPGRGGWYLNLVEVPPIIHDNTQVRITSKAIRLSNGLFYSFLVRINPLSLSIQSFYLSQYGDKRRSFFRIGCRRFNKRTFATILKAAKEARERAAAKR